MNDDPLLPHLYEIVTQPEAEGTILAGGYGMRLKQKVGLASGQRTLIAELPEARATQDLDLFMSMQFWIDTGRARAFRDMLDRLGYQVAFHISRR